MDEKNERLSTTRSTQIWTGLVCVVMFIFLIFGHLLTIRESGVATAATSGAVQYGPAPATTEINYAVLPTEPAVPSATVATNAAGR